jgi:cellulose synthase (UDP-forming)
MPQDMWVEVTGRRRYHRYGERADRTRRVAGVVLLVATTVAAAVYLGWMVTVLNWEAWYLAVPFAAAEVVTLFTVVLFGFLIWYPRHHDEDGLEVLAPVPVDVFISTCGESVEVLERTIVAATRIRYEPKTVYVLDDAGSAEVEALARRCGCRYLSRTERGDAKAGNLNFGLSRTSSPMILALDADQVPEPEILERLQGYMRFPSIAFVQSAQRFLVPRGDPFGSGDELFYRVMQAGKDGHNAAFSCGSGVLYRRAALASVGGFSTWNLVEDVHTSLRMHAAGWRSVYHNHPLSTGTAPADILGVYRQREQWATDSLRLLFWEFPLTRKGLTLSQRLHYFYAGFGYLVSAFVLPFFYVVPAWSSFTGKFILRASALEYARYRGAYLVLSVLAIAVLEHPVSARKPFRIWAGLFPVFMRATVRALRSRWEKPVYQVTDKSDAVPSAPARLVRVLPQALIAAATVAALVYAACQGTLPPGLLAINVLWGLWVVWTMVGICAAAMQTRRPAEHRVPA